MFVAAALSSALMSVASCLPTVVAPVAGPIILEYRAPACSYCPGRRGLVFASREGDPVRAPVGGTVVFAGPVAGTIYVVIGGSGTVDEGPRVTVGRLASLAPAVATAPGGVAGERLVRAGERLGTAGPTTWLGVRWGPEPVDPGPLLRRWRVSLVPTARGSVACPTVVTTPGTAGARRGP